MQVSTKFNVTGQRKIVKFLSLYHKVSRERNFEKINTRKQNITKSTRKLCSFLFVLTLPFVFLPNHLNGCLMALLEKRSHWYWQVPEVYNRISIWQPILSLLLRATDKKKTHSFFSLTPNCSKERVYTNQTNNSKLVSKVKIIFTILSKEVNKNPQRDNSLSAVSNIQKMWIKRFYRNQWCNDTKEQRHVQTKRESNVRSKKKNTRDPEIS